MPTEITSANFSEFFFDSRTHKPQQGQVMACYSATAELAASPDKMNLVNLLQQTEKVKEATQMMKGFFHAHPQDAVRITREIVEDLLVGMSEKEVADKPYRYTCQFFYYTLPEHVPVDDKHWAIIPLHFPSGPAT
jgi:hypothetical protein